MNNAEFKIRTLINSYVNTQEVYTYFKDRSEEDVALPARVHKILVATLYSRFRAAPNIFQDEDLSQEDYSDLVRAIREHIRLYGEPTTEHLLTNLHEKVM